MPLLRALCVMSSPPYKSLPNKGLDQDSELANLFHDFGCNSYHQACDLVWKIPYGRNSNNHDLGLVLKENAGTCSTKHALLKSLANELGIKVDLVLGIYPMSEANTPGIKSVLSNSNMEYLPEAHCYLSYGGSRIDLTKYKAESSQEISEFFMERQIEPSDIGETKRSIHKQFLTERYGESSLEKVWDVREKCISALCT